MTLRRVAVIIRDTRNNCDKSWQGEEVQIRPDTHKKYKIEVATKNFPTDILVWSNADRLVVCMPGRLAQCSAQLPVHIFIAPLLHF